MRHILLSILLCFVYSIDFQSWTWATSNSFICCTVTRIQAFPPPPRPTRGGGGGWRACVVCVRRPEDLFTAGWAGTARKEEWVAGGLFRADRYSRQFLTMHPNRPVRQGKQGGPVQEGSRSGRYGGGVARTEQLSYSWAVGTLMC